MPISHFGCDRQLSYFADLHADHALVPTLDDPAFSELEPEVRSTIDRAVEFLAAKFFRSGIVKPTGIVNDRSLSDFGNGAVAP